MLTIQKTIETFSFTNRGDSVATTIEDRVSAKYSDLSAKLQTAASYVVANPVDVATRSLRSVAQSSGVSPATFSRLARVLGFEDYEALREAGRLAVGERIIPFADRAEALLHDDLDADSFLHRQATTCTQNIALLDQTIDGERLQDAVDALHAAGKVLLIGALGSAGIVDFFAYQAQFFSQNWSVAGRSGASIAASYAQMAPGDAVIVLTKSPHAEQSMRALQAAHQNEFRTIVLTDSHSSPAIQFADHAFVIPTETANFFSSYAATLVLIETMMSMLVAKVGPEAEARIRATEEQTKRLGVSWPT